jgi:GT2 family glycosyltransferase
LPKLSIISIAKNDGEFRSLRTALANQTFRDFEFLTSTKPSIPEAWNDATAKAKGEFLVFTESDALPFDNCWLEDIVAHAKEGCVLKGLEIVPYGLNLCNLVCDASILRQIRFDETFKICEDTELFARLRKNGVNIEYASSFPVIHSRAETWKKTLSRGVRKGMYLVKIDYLYGNARDISARNFERSRLHPVSNRLRIIVEQALVLLGFVVGSVRYSPILIKRRLTQNRESP